MKREAGVTGHEVHREEFGGLAFIGTGRIRSPRGTEDPPTCDRRTRMRTYLSSQLCSWLLATNPRAGDGSRELRTSMFPRAWHDHAPSPLEVGPRLRRFLGRQGSCRWYSHRSKSVAYAKGLRSPYEPLRFVPSTWKIFAGEPPIQLLVDKRDRLNERSAISSAKPTWMLELRELVALCGSNLLVGFAVAQMALFILEIFHPMPDVFPKRPGGVTWAELATAAVGGLIWTNLVVLWRTMTR
jgi:hypothetical protein